MLSNAYFLAKIGFDTAENEPAKNLQNFANFPNFPISGEQDRGAPRAPARRLEPRGHRRVRLAQRPLPWEDLADARYLAFAAQQTGPK